MPRCKKKSDSLEVLPNYRKYKYSDKLPPFNEYDCVSEMELECYNGYEIEASLNQFNDQILNDHLYVIFQKKRLETPALIHKLVSFFVCHYKWPLTIGVQNYLDSKKITLGEVLSSVKNNRRGDILCLYGNGKTYLCAPEERCNVEHIKSCATAS